VKISNAAEIESETTAAADTAAYVPQPCQPIDAVAHAFDGGFINEPD
jgi:hypothetical protein